MNTSANPAQERLHALDGLRAVMMLLGLVLHALCSYTVLGLGSAWPYKDNANALPVDFIVLFIHSFRMPIFFVLAGFFGALLYARRGALGLLQNRWQRIVVPFVVFLLLMWPPLITGFRFANASKAGTAEAAADAVFPQFASWALYLPGTTIHLWFLYYLILFYLIALAAAWVVQRLPVAFRESVTSAFALMLSSPVLRLAVPILVSTLALLPMEGLLATGTAFTPNLAVATAYLLYFAFGWLLYAERQRLESLCNAPWLLVSIAAGLFLCVELVLASALGETLGSKGMLLRAAMGGSVAWLMFYGSTGLFLRYLQGPSALVRWIVDASYWAYLVHLPIVIWTVALLVHSELPVIAKITLVLLTTLSLSFGSYWLFVRSSSIGQLLNGRRLPRGLPGRDSEGSPAASIAGGRALHQKV